MIRSSDDDDDDAENISALLLQCSLLLLLPVGGVCMRFFVCMVLQWIIVRVDASTYLPHYMQWVVGRMSIISGIAMCYENGNGKSTESRKESERDKIESVCTH